VGKEDNLDILTKRDVSSAMKPSPWDFGNSVLYDLCREYPLHNSDAEIIAKVWLIGRSYAAAIERRKNAEVDVSGDGFYISTVAPVIRKSKIDFWLEPLRDLDLVNNENLSRILKVHFDVMSLFREISGLEKRSLASKYLHFHFPELFFMYDSRASFGVSRLSEITGRSGRSTGEYDNIYRKFCEKCLKIREHVKNEFGIELTNRQLDILLLDVAAKQ
jgi:hypothetical protein